MIVEAVTWLAVAFALSPVNAECLPDAEVKARAVEHGIPGAYSFAVVGSRELTMGETACGRLARLVAQPARTTQRRDDWVAFDVMALGHEVAHALGNQDETGATCWSLGRMQRVLEYAGVRAPRARRMRDRMLRVVDVDCAQAR